MLCLGASIAAPAYADRETQAARYYEDALARYQRQDDAGAIIQLKNALKEDSRMLPALVLMGQAYLRKGDPAAAERALSGAENLGAARTQIAVYQAQAYLDQGKARALLEKFGADGLAPHARLDMLLLRARAQIALAQFDAAASSVALAAQISGGEARAMAMQAQIHLYKGQYADAQKAVQRALQLAPRDPIALNTQASIAHIQGDLESALRDYSLAIAAQSNNLDARLARVSIYLDMKRDEAGRADIDYLKKHFAYDPRATYLRALYYSRRGDTANARIALREVTDTLGQVSREFLTGSDQLKLLGGLANHALGEYERAKTYLVAYLERHPNEVGARKLLASIYLKERDYTRTVTMLQPAYLAQPHDAQVVVMLGEAYMGLRNHGKAATMFQEAAQLGDAPAIQTGLGISLLSAGQKEAGLNALVRGYQSGATAQTGAPLILTYLKRNENARAVAVATEIVKREPGNIAMRNLLGVAQLAAGDKAGARASYTAAINAAPSFYSAHYNLARLDETEGQLERARQRYVAVLKVAPNRIEPMLELARLEESAGRKAEAIRWLEKSAGMYGRSTRPWLALHGLYMRNGMAQDALRAAKEAQAKTPDQPETLMALAQGQIAVGNTAMARSVLRRLTQLASFNPAWLTRAAAKQIEIGDSEAAEYSLSKALLAEPDYRAARILQARLNMQNNKLDLAEKQVLALAGAGTPQADSLRLLGEIRLAQKRLPEAVNAYRAAYAREPDNDSVFGLYGALMATKQTQQAAQLMASWHTRYPADPSAAHALGEAWLSLSDLEKAKTVYQSLVQRYPRDARAHNNLANVWLRQNQPAQALKHAEQARALAPNQPQVNDTLGWVLVQMRQTDKGLRYLREAALRNPEDADIQAHILQALAIQRQ